MSHVTEVGVPGNGVPAVATWTLVVHMVGIHRVFDEVRVPDDTDSEVLPDEVHTFTGGNDAGKSTLMEILQGVYSCDTKTIDATGRTVSFASTHDTKRAGAGMVFQGFSLVSTLTVAQNIFLNAEPCEAGLIDDRAIVEHAREIFERIQISVDPEWSLGTLSTVYWQLTEIVRALSEDVWVLIMDESTASLMRHEAQALLDLIGRPKDQGIAVIYVSHCMGEMYVIIDWIIILRNGRRPLTQHLIDITLAQIVEGIVGKEVELADDAGQSNTNGPMVLRAVGLTSSSGIHDVDLVLRADQVVGFAGLMGSGQSELARALYGVDRIIAGMLPVDGRTVLLASPVDALRHGICLISEDRRLQSLILDHSVTENSALLYPDGLCTGLFVDDKVASELANTLIDGFAIKVADPDASACLLPGKDQQKVVIAKWISRTPRVLIMDEPTAGIDIGIRAEAIATVRLCTS